MATVLLELPCTYPTGATRVGQRLMPGLWYFWLDSTSALVSPVLFVSCKCPLYFVCSSRVGRLMGWEPGREGRRGEIGQIGDWQSSFLSRMSVDEIPRASCERSLISIKPDLDVIGFGLRLSKSSLAHLTVYSVARLHHEGWHPHWDRQTASGTPEKGGCWCHEYSGTPALGTSQIVGA